MTTDRRARRRRAARGGDVASELDAGEENQEDGMRSGVEVATMEVV